MLHEVSMQIPKLLISHTDRGEQLVRVGQLVLYDVHEDLDREQARSTRDAPEGHVAGTHMHKICVVLQDSDGHADCCQARGGARSLSKRNRNRICSGSSPTLNAQKDHTRKHRGKKESHFGGISTLGLSQY